jgi:uncharacterized membrane protein YfcA
MTITARPLTQREPGPWSLLRVQLPIVAVVWLAWAVFGGARAVEALHRNWAVTVTMVFGSLVGGGTSEGGGAVAFPVFTKILAIPAGDARIFTYLIQSVGMTAASLCILAMRVPVERRVVLLGGGTGVLGVVFGATVLAPHLPLPTVRLYFTVLLTSLAIALVIKNRRRGRLHLRVPVFGAREVAIVAAAGFGGGIVSGLVGVGENTIMFIVLVLLFRVSEKIATPTTVLMMTIVSIAAALTHAVLLRDVSPAVVGYWLAAVPVVCVFAPIGALICAYMSRESIWRLLVALIGVEFLSTLVLVPMSDAAAWTAAGVLVVVTLGCRYLSRVPRYAVESPVGL